MAKTKKKNSNYAGWQPPKPEQPENKEPSRFGIPGWAVAVCFVVLVIALVLYTQGSGTGWSVVATYLLTAVPALVLAAGQRLVKQETGSRTAAVLMWLLAIIGVLYLVSGIAGAINLLQA